MGKEKPDVGSVTLRATRLFDEVLDRLEACMDRLPVQEVKPEHIGDLVGILRGAELVWKHIEKARSALDPDVPATLAELFKEWDGEQGKADEAMLKHELEPREEDGASRSSTGGK